MRTQLGGRLLGIGTWSASSPVDQVEVAHLDVEPRLLIAPDAAARLLDVVQADHLRPVAGVLPVLGWEVQDGHARITCAGPAGPTVAEVAEAGSGVDLPAAAAAVILLDVASTLRRLHRDGRRHGRLTSTTVVLTRAGTAVVREPGWHAALVGASCPVAWDVDAWQRLALVLADRLDAAARDGQAGTASRADQRRRALIRNLGNRSAGPAGDLALDSAVADLIAVLDEDAVHAARLALAELAAGGDHSDAVSVAASADTVGATGAAEPGGLDLFFPTADADLQPAPPALPVAGEVIPAPRQHRDDPSAGEPSADPTDHEQKDPEPTDPEPTDPDPTDPDPTGTAAPTALAPQPDPPVPAIRVHFGPGVPAQPERPPSARRASPRHRRSARSRRARLARIAAWGGTVLVVGLVAWLLWPPGSATVRSVELAARPTVVPCGVPVDLVAAVRTNGRAGAISYRWVRSDGVRSELLTERLVRGQTRAELHLRWDIVGQGRFDGSARLEIERPASPATGELTGSTAFHYSCSS